MIKKTLQQYKREFEELDEDSEEYKILAEECIADYPDDELGYEELGIYYRCWVLSAPDDYEVYDNLTNDILEKSKQNTKWGITFGYIIEAQDNSDFLEYFSKDSFLKHKDFSQAWASLARNYFWQGLFKEAGFCVNVAYSLGFDILNYLETYSMSLNPFIDKINIQKFLSIQDLKIEDLRMKNEIYFLGENGVGKTALLQAILLSLIKDENELTIKFGKPLDSYIDFDVSYYAPYTYQNIFAYGISRFRSSPKYTDAYGYATLFDHDTYLTNPEEWLKDIQRKELLGKSNISLNSVMQMLTEIINFEGNEFKIVYNSNNDKFEFIEKDTPTKFEHLADGYRSVLVWLCDLLHRLSTNQPFVKNIKYFGGIVLIDEIDMLLHPKWEYSIVKQLRNKLPNIQWFFTTHSPMLILGASEDAVFYKLYKEAGQTKISEQWKCSDINNMLANSIITSPLFDLETAQMRAFDEKKQIDTNTNYWYSRVEKIINQERAKQKLAGKAYFSDQEIDEIVQKAIVLLKNGGE